MVRIIPARVNGVPVSVRLDGKLIPYISGVGYGIAKVRY
jgi:hypothetical protein